MLNIVVPMAGAGSRFSKAGFVDPKPLIKVHGYPMIEIVVGNLRPSTEHRFIFICQNDHVRQYSLDTALSRFSPGCKIIGIDGVTEGAACTVLKAKELINSDESLMIANSDQFIDCEIDSYLEDMRQDSVDGLIMTMKASDPKWSFVKIDELGFAIEVAEKKPISEIATVGVYNFARGLDFVNAAETMISKNERVNNEFYVAPVYNVLIGQGKKIGIHNIDSVVDAMHGLGTPADLAAFLTLPNSLELVKATVCR